MKVFKAPELDSSVTNDSQHHEYQLIKRQNTTRTHNTQGAEGKIN